MEEELKKCLDLYDLSYLKIDAEESLVKIYNLWVNDTFEEPVLGIELFYYGSYYQNVKKNHELMEKYYVKLDEDSNNENNEIFSGNEKRIYSSIYYNLALYYEDGKNYDLMKKNYLMSVELGNYAAMNNLGRYYKIIEKDYDLMKKYFLMAIELGNDNTMNSLALYYQKYEQDYDLMKKYFLMAIKAGNCAAMNDLALYYFRVEKYDLMKKYYLMAIKGGNYKSISIKDLLKYYKRNEDLSFIQIAVEYDIIDEFTELLNQKFTHNIDLPKELHFYFCQFKDLDPEVRMKQYILQKTLVFPRNYSHKYDIQFMELLSMSSSNKYVFPKDILLLIAGFFYV